MVVCVLLFATASHKDPGHFQVRHRLVFKLRRRHRHHRTTYPSRRTTATNDGDEKDSDYIQKLHVLQSSYDPKFLRHHDNCLESFGIAFFSAPPWSACQPLSTRISPIIGIMTLPFPTSHVERLFAVPPSGSGRVIQNGNVRGVCGITLWKHRGCPFGSRQNFTHEVGARTYASRRTSRALTGVAPKTGRFRCTDLP